MGGADAEGEDAGEEGEGVLGVREGAAGLARARKIDRNPKTLDTFRITECHCMTAPP